MKLVGELCWEDQRGFPLIENIIGEPLSHLTALRDSVFTKGDAEAVEGYLDAAELFRSLVLYRARHDFMVVASMYQNPITPLSALVAMEDELRVRLFFEGGLHEWEKSAGGRTFRSPLL